MIYCYLSCILFYVIKYTFISLYRFIFYKKTCTYEIVDIINYYTMASLPKNTHFGHFDIPDETFALLLSLAPYWQDFKSRGRNYRKIDQILLFNNLVPHNYQFLQPVVNLMINKLNEIHGPICTPFNIVLCYYPNGISSTGMHRHNCRSITLSLGESREFKVNTKKIAMSHGDYIIINRQNHGVPKMENKSDRISINMFYYIQGDENVSIQYNKTPKKS